MNIIIGLGNPGEQYKNTRHNVGFMAIDAFAKKNNFPEFELQKKSNALVSEKDKVILVKPQTFMNESGKAIKTIIKNKTIENLVVIHDDIDLPVGKIKIIKERGSAGHKGVESIIQNIGNEGLVRFRIGIGFDNKVEAMEVVLKNFSEEEQKIIDETINKTASALDLFIKEGLDKAMNGYNK
ncbi:MAG: aminoacyl-tRNA hydrolase [Candidatus Staskawiczbacteria bacterium]|nr:aminoacyl-tRNA hydrolase [Candidatus Staskawiczbacteria bacterium]